MAALFPPGPLDLSYRVATCTTCGMAYADLLAPESSYQAYYKAFSKYDLIRDKASIPAMEAARADGAVQFLRRHLPAARSIYDIGCSVGVFLDRCRHAAFDRVTGTDPAPEARTLASRLFNIEIETGFFCGNRSLAEFDIVSFAAVLEHLWSPSSALAELAAAMRTGSHLYIEVPAGERFGELSGEALGEFSLEHINYFGRTSLGRLAARYGFVERAGEHYVCTNGTYGLRCLYSLQSDRSTSREAFDQALLTSLDRYVAKGKTSHENQAEEIALRGSAEVILYGAGSHTARLLPLLQDRSVTVRALLDRNENLQGKFLGGVPILRPEALAELRGLPVAISSYHAQREITAFLEGAYGNEVIHLYPFTPRFGPGIGEQE
jgi:SAM-dependent methyltransferase